MKRFIKMECSGWFNSFRQPDFHTYHKTLPLPPKTTIGGMIGGALGISPMEVNDKWLKTNRFQVGIVGQNNGKASDLWQIRKYEGEQIKAYQSGKEKAPYRTAVIVRELLFNSQFCIYLSFNDDGDFDLVKAHLENPKWALSLGREDELVLIKTLETVQLLEVENKYYQNTVLPFDANTEGGYHLRDLKEFTGRNMLSEAPRSLRLPMTFTHKGEAREADTFSTFTFVSTLPILPKIHAKGFWDDASNNVFQIF
jgi:CRISPR-associated protein Cas5t